MTTFLLVFHLLVTLAMIGLILLQRSEGGGLGIGGGGGGMGSFATPRATANALTKATMICFALFVVLSLILAVMAGHRNGGSLLDKLDTPVESAAPASAAPTEQPPSSSAPAVPISK